MGTIAKEIHTTPLGEKNVFPLKTTGCPRENKECLLKNLCCVIRCCDYKKQLCSKESLLKVRVLLITTVDYSLFPIIFLLERPFEKERNP